MRTRTFRLTEAEANQLHAAYLHMPDADTKTRYQAVRLYGLGYSVARILDICGCSTTRLMEWCRAYREQGLTALLDHRQAGNSAKLKPEQIETLCNQAPALHARASARTRRVWAKQSSGAWPIWPVW